MTRRKRQGIATAAAIAVLSGFMAISAARGAILSLERVSEDGAGNRANKFCGEPSINADGRFVAFSSDADNLFAGDTNKNSDVFVADRQTGLVEHVSVSSAEVKGDNFSVGPTISADGRYVAFLSHARNLVPGDTNNLTDVFVRDRQLGTTVRASIRSDGSQVPEIGGGHAFSAAISGDGRFVVMQFDADLIGPEFDDNSGIYVRDLVANVTERVGIAQNGLPTVRGDDCDISDDGRFVVFDTAQNGVAPNDQNSAGDIYVRDRVSNTTEWVSTGIAPKAQSGLSLLPKISPDGRYVTFVSGRSDLVAGDTNDVPDVFLRDRQPGITERISVGAGGVQGNGHSATTSRPSADGRLVAFGSTSNILVPNDTNVGTDLFVRDRQLGTTRLLSRREDGELGPGIMDSCALSDDGRAAAFASRGLLLPPEVDVQIYVVEFDDSPDNRPPTANAPSDRTIKTKAAKAKVKLDGSGSSDPDKDKLTFTWFEGKTQIATGVKPTVKLKKGVHTITLEVRDSGGLTDTDEVVITVKRKRR